ncbi:MULTISPECIES: BON domain-containing protein [unclassified Paraburkholderia]|uniref:BON domain-containing protein n=1 Tax=unclassified Paraburkholderia TaxID=2615204 RepID=UPI002AB64588|nr:MULTISPECIES: BON domain-containing protein [unclassified Paraburkholderia]
MKFHRIGGCVVGALIVAASLHAHAQSSGAAPAVVASAGASTPVQAKAADRALRKRVLTALGKAKGLRASGVTVRVNNGAVTLQGWVPEQAQIERAADIAQSVPGVTAVKNELTLSTF